MCRKLTNDDYADKDPEQALKDFRHRVAEYEKVYETVEDNEDAGNACYVKVYNVSGRAVDCLERMLTGSFGLYYYCRLGKRSKRVIARDSFRATSCPYWRYKSNLDWCLIIHPLTMPFLARISIYVLDAFGSFVLVRAPQAATEFWVWTLICRQKATASPRPLAVS